MRNNKGENVLKSLEENLVFFLNLHNFIILFALCKTPSAKFPKNIQEWAKYSESLTMKIDQFIFNPFEIQHGIIRACMGPASYFNQLELVYPLYAAGDLKGLFKLGIKNPIINFGFYFPFVSNPPLKLFTPQNVMENLKQIVLESLKSAGFEKSKSEMNLPAIIKGYEEDFIHNGDRTELFKFLEFSLSDHKGLKDIYEAWYLSYFNTIVRRSQ